MSHAAPPTKAIAMRDALLERIWLRMKEDQNIFFVCADFGSPVLDRIRADCPGRFANVGIAEQNLINVSAGLALEGFTVFAYAIAPFITMRCYEQVRVNLALLSQVRPMNVNLIGVGAGYSYVVSGPTHQCYEDLTLMRAMPNMRVLSPADHVCSAALFERCISTAGPKYLRLDAQVLSIRYPDGPPDLDRGFHVHRRGRSTVLVATGYMVHTALKVADTLRERGIDIGVIDLIDITHHNECALSEALVPYGKVISMEEGFAGRGGLDAMLFDLIRRHQLPVQMDNIGVRGGYRFDLGTREELHEQAGIGVEAVLKRLTADETAEHV